MIQTLPEVPTFLQEFLNFKAKPTASANDTPDSWRENPRDDLVLAIAIAVWIGERQMRRLWIG